MSLAEARRALRENDWHSLAAHLQDPEIAAVMTKGVSLTKSFNGDQHIDVEDDCEVGRRGTNKSQRAAYGLTVARAAGLLDECVALNAYLGGVDYYVGTDSLSSLSCIEGLPKLGKLTCDGSDLGLLASLPALRELSVDEDARPAGRLADLRSLRVLRLRRSQGGDTGASRAALLDAAAALPLEELTLAGCTVEDLARVAKIGTLCSLSIHLPYELTPLSTLEPLRNHPALRSLTLRLRTEHVAAVDVSALASIASLEVFDIDVPVTSLAWVSGTPRLRILNLGADGSARSARDAAEDLAPLAGARALKELRVGGTVPDLTPLGALSTLRILDVHAKRGAAVLGALMGLADARLDVADADLATLEALGAISGLAKLSLATSAALQPFPVHALTSSARCIDFLRALRGARLPRTLPALDILAKPDTVALRALNTAFKGAKVSRDALPAIRATPPDVLSRICAHAGLRVGEDGALAWNGQGLRFPKVTHESELLLALADAVGLLDGLTYFCARSDYLDDLGALKRHASTLAWVYGDSVWVGGGVRANLDEVEPVPAAAETAGEEGVPDNLLTLLQSSDLAGVQQGAELAATLGLLDALLEGCGYVPGDRTWFMHSRLVPPCPGCSGTGRRGVGLCGACDGNGVVVATKGECAARIVKALLAAAPRGSEVAATVTRAVTHLDLFDGTDLPWLHHARSLAQARLSWEVLQEHVDTLAGVPALRALTFVTCPEDPDAALAVLQRLPQVTTFRFDGGAPLSLLAGLGITHVRQAVVQRA